VHQTADTHTRMHMQTHTHVDAHADTHARMHVQTQTFLHADTSRRTRAHKQTHTRTDAQADTHRHGPGEMEEVVGVEVGRDEACLQRLDPIDGRVRVRVRVMVWVPYKVP
jgi:hypothetical protein